MLLSRIIFIHAFFKVFAGAISFLQASKMLVNAKNYAFFDSDLEVCYQRVNLTIGR